MRSLIYLCHDLYIYVNFNSCCNTILLCCTKISIFVALSSLFYVVSTKIYVASSQQMCVASKFVSSSNAACSHICAACTLTNLSIHYLCCLSLGYSTKFCQWRKLVLLQQRKVFWASRTKTLLQQGTSSQNVTSLLGALPGLRDLYKVTVITESHSLIKLNQIRNSRESIKYSTALLYPRYQQLGIISWHLNC